MEAKKKKRRIKKNKKTYNMMTRKQEIDLVLDLRLPCVTYFAHDTLLNNNNKLNFFSYFVFVL